MGWQFWKSESTSGVLPERMNRNLGWRFSLDNELLARLRFVSKPGQIGNAKTSFVRVFDPGLLSNSTQKVKRYEDLDSQSSAIQFECRWQNRKVEDAVDMRAGA